MREPQWIDDLRDEVKHAHTRPDYAGVDEELTLGKARELISHLDTINMQLRSLKR